MTTATKGGATRPRKSGPKVGIKPKGKTGKAKGKTAGGAKPTPRERPTHRSR